MSILQSTVLSVSVSTMNRSSCCISLCPTDHLPKQRNEPWRALPNAKQTLKPPSVSPGIIMPETSSVLLHPYLVHAMWHVRKAANPLFSSNLTSTCGEYFSFCSRLHWFKKLGENVDYRTGYSRRLTLAFLLVAFFSCDLIVLFDTVPHIYRYCQGILNSREVHDFVKLQKCCSFCFWHLDYSL